MALFKAPHPERARSAQSKDVQRRSSRYYDTCPASEARTRGRRPGMTPQLRAFRARPQPGRTGQISRDHSFSSGNFPNTVALDGGGSGGGGPGTDADDSRIREDGLGVTTSARPRTPPRICRSGGQCPWFDGGYTGSGGRMDFVAQRVRFSPRKTGPFIGPQAPPPPSG